MSLLHVAGKKRVHLIRQALLSPGMSTCTRRLATCAFLPLKHAFSQILQWYLALQLLTHLACENEKARFPFDGM